MTPRHRPPAPCAHLPGTRRAARVAARTRHLEAASRQRELTATELHELEVLLWARAAELRRLRQRIAGSIAKTAALQAALADLASLPPNPPTSNPRETTQ